MNSFWKDLQDMYCVPGVGGVLGSLHGPIAVGSQSSREMRMWGLEGWSPGLEWALSAPLGWRVMRAARLSADMGSEGSPLVVNWSPYGFILPFKWLSDPKEIQLYCRRQEALCHTPSHAQNLRHCFRVHIFTAKNASIPGLISEDEFTINGNFPPSVVLGIVA